jgi:hypothetical protein
MRIAYIASDVTLPGSTIRRGDGFEHDHMMALLQAGFSEIGGSIMDVSWSDPQADWSSYDAAIIGTAWDYWDRLEEFLATLGHIASATRLYNPLELVHWNIHKTYLRDLEARGAKLIPTLWIDQMTEQKARAAFRDLQSEDLVFKRQIGAGAFDQHRLRAGDPIPAMTHPTMVQPFLPMIETEGELSFIFIDGELSHALIKRAAPGDYRIQSLYGGVETAIVPDGEDVRAARAVLDTLDDTPLYARVDMLRDGEGGLLLMELELIEPYLYPVQGPDIGRLLASAVRKRLAA